MKFHSNTDYLSSLIGRKLSNALGLMFCGNKDSEPLSTDEVLLEFGNSQGLRIFCGADGSSICWDNDKLKPVSMDEYGEAVVRSISESDTLWKSLIDEELEEIYLVRSEIEKCIFAIKFVFSKSLELTIANLGDDLKIQRNLAINILEEEQASFLRLEPI